MRQLGQCDGGRVLWWTENVSCMFGEWVHGRNAGGSISHQTLDINPQFAFIVRAGARR